MQAEMKSTGASSENTLELPRKTVQRIEDVLDIFLGGYGNLIHPNDKLKLLSVRQEVNAALADPMPVSSAESK